MSDLPRTPFNCDRQGAASWQQRATAATDLLAPLLATTDGSLRVVADVGCGDQKLRRALADRSLRCEYRGYDLLPQTPDTTRCDLHTDTLPGTADVIVMLGVLEYLRDLPAVLRRLPHSVPWLLVSHVVRERSRYTEAQLRELGWINHLTTTDLERLLLASGFHEHRTTSTDEGRVSLFLCSRTPPAPSPATAPTATR